MAERRLLVHDRGQFRGNVRLGPAGLQRGRGIDHGLAVPLEPGQHGVVRADARPRSHGHIARFHKFPIHDIRGTHPEVIAVSEDFPAFIVNRILLPMINEAIYTLYEGVGGVEAIDTAMKLGARHPMGPLELADFIGLDTCLSVMQVLHDGLADSKYRPCPLLVKYVEAGWLGRKTNRGFYDYRGETPVPTR